MPKGRAFIGGGGRPEPGIANVYAAHGIGRWIAIQSSLPRKLLRGQRHFWRSRGRAARRRLGKHIREIKIRYVLRQFTHTKADVIQVAHQRDSESLLWVADDVSGISRGASSVSDCP